MEGGDILRTGSVSHECQGRREGDWIIYRCSKCRDYQRRMNWRTGETDAQNVKVDVNHIGSFVPKELELQSEKVH